MAGNKPISDNTAFPFENNVRAIAGIAGFKTGAPNTNTKIGGIELVQSVINASSANAGGIPVYSTSGSGKELATYVSLNYTNGTTSTPSILELGTPSNPSTVQISGNYNHDPLDPSNPYISPKLSFITKNATTGSNTVSIEPSSSATADQSLIIPPAPGTVGQALKAASVSSGDVELEWYTPTDDDTTYSLGTTNETTFGQIDLTPSTGTGDSITLTGAGTVSVASNGSGAITITGSGGGGAASFTTLTPGDVIDWDYATDGPNIVLTTGTTFENVLTVDDITEFPEGTEGWFIVTRDTNGVFKLPDEDDGSAVGITSLVPGGDISTGGSAPTVFHYVYDGETFWWTKFNNMEQPLNYPELPPGVDYTTADLLYYQDPRSYNTSSTTVVAVPNNTVVEDLSATNDQTWRTTISSSSYDIDFYPKDALVSTANPLGAAFYSFNGGSQNRIVRTSDYGAQISNTTTFSAWIQGPYNLSSPYQTLVDYDGGSSYVQAMYLDLGEWVYSYSPVIATFTYPQLKNWKSASTSGLGTDLSNEWLFVNVCNLPGSGTGSVKMGIGCKSSRDWAIANPPAVPGGTTDWDYEEGNGTGATVPVNADGMWFEEFTSLSNTETNIVNVNIFNGINTIAEDFEGHLGICGIFTKYLSNSDMTANFNATQGNYFT